MSRVKTVSQFVNAADNLYDGFKAYGKLSKMGKPGKVLAEIGGKTSNVFGCLVNYAVGIRLLI